MATVLTDRTRFLLDEDRIPRAWYNIAADLPTAPPPPLHPGTGQPIGPGDPRVGVGIDRHAPDIPDLVRESLEKQVSSGRGPGEPAERARYRAAPESRRCPPSSGRHAARGTAGRGTTGRTSALARGLQPETDSFVAARGPEGDSAA